MSIANDFLAGLPPELAAAAADLTASAEVVILRQQAQALQVQAGQLLDQADAAELQAVLDRAVTEAEERVRSCADMVPAAEDRARAAKHAMREAQDRAQAAAEHARKLADAYADHSAGMTAEDATDALMRAEKAATVAAERGRDADLAAEARAAADADVVQVRQLLRGFTAEAEAARVQAAEPPAAPWSVWTAWFDGLRRSVCGDTTPSDVVRTQLTILAEAAGLADLWRKQGRNEAEAERRERVQAARMGQGSLYGGNPVS